MNLKRLANIATIPLVLIGLARANPHQLDTISYNFQLSGGGGGVAAQLDKSLNIEIFCVDFANEIFVPQNNYSANLTSITAAGFVPNVTRFGNNASWRPVNISDDASDGGSNDAIDSAIINGADALGRYQMAAYLVSQYNRAGGSSTYNNGIQSAIWDILSPTSYALPPNYANPSSALEQTAEWFNSTTAAGRDSYLADYRIVSDSSMVSCGPVLCGGFQEQITVVPEPTHMAFLLAGLLSIFVVGKRILGSALRKRAVAESLF